MKLHPQRFFEETEGSLVPISPSLPVLTLGIKHEDFGFLTDLRDEEVEFIRKTDPIAAKYLRPIMGQDEFLKDKKKWCLWLEGATNAEISESRELSYRVESARTALRYANSEDGSRASNLDLPGSVEMKIKQPSEEYLAIPLHPLEKYQYVPVDLKSSEFITKHTIGVIASNKRLAMGILSSYAFKVWNRTIANELPTGYESSIDITYRAFPLPDLSTDEIEAIEEGARGISKARAYLGRGNLNRMYAAGDKTFQLREAHSELNGSLYEILGIRNSHEEEIIKRLSELYDELSQKPGSTTN